MPHGQSVAGGTEGPPFGHEAANHGQKAGVVRRLQQVGYFVDDEISEAFPGHLCEVGCEPDVTPSIFLVPVAVR